MRLISYNVEYCQGINRRWKYLEVPRYLLLLRKNLEKITDFFKTLNPDILGLIEIDADNYKIKGKKLAIELFSEKIRLPYFVAKNKYSRKSFYKFLNFAPITKKNANAILSNQPLFDTKYYFLSKGVKRLVIHTKIKVPIEGTLINLHLFAIHLALRQKTRQKQLQEISQLVNACDGPKIVFGDFNNFKGYEELYYLMENSKLENTAKYSKKEIIKTFPSWKPKRQIDHILVSKDIKIKNFEVLKVEFSDHLPIMIDFELE